MAWNSIKIIFESDQKINRNYLGKKKKLSMKEFHKYNENLDKEIFSINIF